LLKNYLNGKIKTPYFAHYPDLKNDCNYYERPSESQIHARHGEEDDPRSAKWWAHRYLWPKR
jgi:hypothetical protein